MIFDEGDIYECELRANNSRGNSIKQMGNRMHLFVCLFVCLFWVAVNPVEYELSLSLTFSLSPNKYS